DSVPDVDVLLTGVPFDGGSSFRPGARLGPRAVRDASSLARGFSAALDIDIALEAVASRAEAIARSGVVSGFIGGDQTATLGALRGIHRAKLRAVGLVHIDAHTNTAGPAWGRDIH